MARKESASRGSLVPKSPSRAARYSVMPIKQPPPPKEKPLSSDSPRTRVVLHELGLEPSDLQRLTRASSSQGRLNGRTASPSPSSDLSGVKTLSASGGRSGLFDEEERQILDDRRELQLEHVKAQRQRLVSAHGHKDLDRAERAAVKAEEWRTSKKIRPMAADRPRSSPAMLRSSSKGALPAGKGECIEGGAPKSTVDVAIEKMKLLAKEEAKREIGWSLARVEAQVKGDEKNKLLAEMERARAAERAQLQKEQQKKQEIASQRRAEKAEQALAQKEQLRLSQETKAAEKIKRIEKFKEEMLEQKRRQAQEKKEAIVDARRKLAQEHEKQLAEERQRIWEKTQTKERLLREMHQQAQEERERQRREREVADEERMERVRLANEESTHKREETFKVLDEKLEATRARGVEIVNQAQKSFERKGNKRAAVYAKSAESAKELRTSQEQRWTEAYQDKKARSEKALLTQSGAAEGAMSKIKERKALWNACVDDNLQRLRRAGQFQRAHFYCKLEEDVKRVKKVVQEKDHFQQQRLLALREAQAEKEAFAAVADRLQYAKSRDELRILCEKLGVDQELPPEAFKEPEKTREDTLVDRGF